MAVATTTSANNMYKLHQGTFQEVLDALESDKINNIRNVKFIYQSTSNIIAIVVYPSS